FSAAKSSDRSGSARWDAPACAGRKARGDYIMNRSILAAILSTSSAAALGLSLSFVAAPALAQDEPLASDRVVVTGSRIARRDFQANSPIVTVNEGTFEERSSFAVEAALNQLPQFTPGQSQNLGSGGGSPFVD